MYNNGLSIELGVGAAPQLRPQNVEFHESTNQRREINYPRVFSIVSYATCWRSDDIMSCPNSSCSSGGFSSYVTVMHSAYKDRPGLEACRGRALSAEFPDGQKSNERYRIARHLDQVSNCKMYNTVIYNINHRDRRTCQPSPTFRSCFTTDR